MVGKRKIKFYITEEGVVFPSQLFKKSKILPKKQRVVRRKKKIVLDNTNNIDIYIERVKRENTLQLC